jgi:hypothetical protein
MMSLTALILYSYFEFDGVIVGASALSIGVLAEAVVSRLMSNKIIKNLKERKSNKDLTYREIISFYYPLALTSLLGLGVYPMVTFFIGQSRMPLESLAVLPVINSLYLFSEVQDYRFKKLVLLCLVKRDKTIYHLEILQ